MRVFLLLILLGGVGCDCGTTLARRPECDIDPNATGCQPPPNKPPPHNPPPNPSTCPTGSVTGVVCAPDQMTTVAGATVTVSGTCDGKAFTVTTATNSMGDYTLNGVPAGSWTISLSSGSFMQTVPVTVTANKTTDLPVNQNDCFKPTTNLAVISGSGDQIENLLTQVGFMPTVIDGTTTGFNGPTGGLQFLKDPNQLAKYQVLFIDCGAGRTESGQQCTKDSDCPGEGCNIQRGQSTGTCYSGFNFASDAQTIAQNLRDFVKNGGSVYASDWAFVFLYLAWPEQFQWQTNCGTSASPGLTLPFSPSNVLMGAPNQTPMATVVDTGLSGYLGKSMVDVTFPQKMSHWGLLSTVNSPAVELMTGSVGACADGAATCSTGKYYSCNSATGATTVPLAALYRVTNGPGGAVAYTSFHNINQTDPTDVENILKYLIFKL